jgi:hypothetical protein
MADGLTPMGSALSRSTPGFDTLIESIQGITNKIERNREFAKQLNARKEFAMFQSELQTKQAVEQAEAMIPIQVKATRAVGEAETDVAIDRMDKTMPIEVDYYEQQQDIVNEHALEQIKERGAQQRQTEAARPQTSGTGTGNLTDMLRLQVDIEDREADRIKSNYPFASDEYYKAPTFNTETQEFAPVQLTIGTETYEMSMGQYHRWMSVQDRALRIEKKYEELLKTPYIANATAEEGGVGKREMNAAISEIRQARTNILPGEERDLLEVVEMYSDKVPEYISKDRTESRQVFQEGWEDMRQPIMSNRTDFDGTVFNQSKPEEYVQQRLKSLGDIFMEHGIDPITGINENTGEPDNRYLKINRNYLQTADELPRDYLSLIPNWDFDPTQRGSTYENAFLTREQASRKLINQLKRESDVNSANVQSTEVRSVLSRRGAQISNNP